MNPFSILIYQPLYNLLIFFYNIIPLHDFGIALVIVTVLLKLALAPIYEKQIKNQKKQMELQPKMEEMLKKYKNDKEKKARAQMDFYKEHKFNPLGGCLPVIFQSIFFILFYRIIFNISSNGFIVDQAQLYPFMHNPGNIDHLFIGIFDLSSKIDLSVLKTFNPEQFFIGISGILLNHFPHLILVLITTAAQYIQLKMITPKSALKIDNSKQPSLQQTMSQQTLILIPLMTLFIGLVFPAGLALYWLVSTVFAIIQQSKLAKKETAVVKSR